MKSSNFLVVFTCTDEMGTSSILNKNIKILSNMNEDCVEVIKNTLLRHYNAKSVNIVNLIKLEEPDSVFNKEEFDIIKHAVNSIDTRHLDRVDKFNLMNLKSKLSELIM